MNESDHINAPVCLTIAGFDPSGGAGVIADCKTFTAFDCVPTAAVTSLTFQNDRAVLRTKHQSAETVLQQIQSIAAASQIAAVKTGMLPTAEIVREIAQLFHQESLPAPVVDPVLRSTSGFQLVEPDAVPFLLSDLMPLARLITPNTTEAEHLTGLQIEDEDGMRAAARKLREMGARAVLVKGGHLCGAARGSEQVNRVAIDVLDDEGEVTVFRSEWIDAPPVRGTGCMVSAAIASCLAKGMRMEEAVSAAKSYVAEIIRRASISASRC